MYEAEDTTTEQRVAVKILPRWNVPPTLRDRLGRDMASAIKLQEPHIVPVHAWGEIDDRLYLQMRLVDGTDLQTLLDRDGPLRPARAVDIVGQIGEALDAAHLVGLVHSGVAPENVLVTRDGHAYLMGFGYRGFLAGAETWDDVIDTDPRLPKTPVRYPEQVAGGEPTHRADTHGLGRVLNACLTGVRSYPATPPPPSASQPRIPRRLDDVVARGMATRPEDRYPSAGELARAARDALNGLPGSGPPTEFGRYRLVRLLAEGRCRVYEADDTASRQRVALKVVGPATADDPGLTRVQRQVEVLTRPLESRAEPHLVLVRDVGVIDGWLYLQMPFVDGIDLRELLIRTGPLPPRRAVAIVGQISAALDAAHAAGALHRNVCPQNILVTDDDSAHLLGLVSMPHVERDRSGPSIGQDFGYTAPERFSIAETTPSADAYSLACVLYECLTGTQPFPGDDNSIEPQVMAILNEDAPEPSAVKPFLPRAFDEVIARGMAKRPEDRYASAGDLADAARNALKSAGDLRAQEDFGRYRLRRVLGRGSIGDVYEAEDTAKGRIVALKVFGESVSSDSRLRNYLSPQIDAASRLQTPHVAAIHEFGEIDGRQYLDMLLVDGTGLSAILAHDGSIEPARAVAIVDQIAEALDAAHGIDVIHGHIDPSQILVTQRDYAYLLDFVNRVGHLDDSSEPLFPASTFAYFAPERFAEGTADASTDIYALACLLYQCLTGARPFADNTLKTLAVGHLTKEPPKPTDVNPVVPEGFDRVIARGMAKSPADRYASAGQLVRAARDALATPARAEIPLGRTVKFSNVDLPTKSLPIPPQIPKCIVCGRSVVEDPGRTWPGNRICWTCHDETLARELQERFRRGAGEPLTAADYTLLHELDRGGFGPSFRARDHRDGRLCDLTVAPATAVAPGERDKYRALENVRALRHRNIVALLGFTAVGKFYFLASEYCPGETVEGLVRRLGPLTVDQALPLALECLDGLHYAHTVAPPHGSIGFMHREITPANILLTWSGGDPITKLAEFGLAAPLDDAGRDHLAFMPRPQFADPTRAPGVAVDVWRLGACLYYILTGQPPRELRERADLANGAMNTPAVPIRQRNPTIPPRLAAVIDEALVDTPAIRIGSARELASALHDAANWSAAAVGPGGGENERRRAVLRLTLPGACALSSDGRLALTVSPDSAAIWDITERTARHTLTHGGEVVASAILSRDGQIAVTVGTSATVVWDATTGQPIHKLGFDGDGGGIVTFSPDGRLALIAGKYLSMWDCGTGGCLGVLSGRSEIGRWTAVGNNGVAVSGDRLSVSVWVSGGRRDHIAGDLVNSLTLSDDGRRGLVSIHEIGMAYVFDTSTGETLAGVGECEADAGWLTADGRLALTRDDDSRTPNLALLWDVDTCQLLHELGGHTDVITSALFSSDGEWLLTAAADRTVRMWNTSIGACVHTFARPDGDARPIALSGDGRTALIGNSIWDIDLTE